MAETCKDAVYNTVNLHICVCTFGRIYHKELSVYGRESFNIDLRIFLLCELYIYIYILFRKVHGCLMKLNDYFV